MADITSKPDIFRQAIASGKIQLKPSTIVRGLPVEDPSGDIIKKLIREAGHRVTGRKLILDKIGLLRTTVRQVLKSEADAIIVSSDARKGAARIWRDISKDQLRHDWVSRNDATGDSRHSQGEGIVLAARGRLMQSQPL